MSFEDAVQELEQYKRDLAQAQLEFLQAETKKEILEKRGQELKEQLEKAAEEEKRIARETNAQNDKIDTVKTAIRSKKEYLKYDNWYM